MTVRLIQVGLGDWGRDWATTVLPHSAGVEVVAWVDPDPAARDLARALVGAPAERFRPSLTETLAEVPADAVLVTSGIPSHVPLALEALRAGRHVLLEKPFALTLPDAAAAVTEAHARGLVLAIAQNYRHYPSMRTIVELVRDGTLGAVDRVRVDFRRYRPGLGRAPVDDEIFTQLSIHHFDLMRAVLGDAEWISCHAWDPPWYRGFGPVCAAAVIRFHGGPVVTYTASRVSTGPATPWEGEWHLECERGEIAWAPDEIPGQILVRPVDGPVRPIPLPAAPPSDRAELLAAFAAAVAGGATPTSPGHDNIASVALMLAARESARTGALPVIVASPT